MRSDSGMPDFDNPRIASVQFGQRIKKLRAEHGVSKETLARHLSAASKPHLT
jgi:DNA-binding XRE family transcriptional regulator